MKTLRLTVAAAFALLLSASFVRADVGDLALISFEGVVTKVSTGADAEPDDFWIAARVFVKVTTESGEVTTGVGEIQFQSSMGAVPQVGNAIDGDVLTQVVGESTTGEYVIAKVLDGRWFTAKASGGIPRGSILGVSTGASATPDD